MIQFFCSVVGLFFTIAMLFAPRSQAQTPGVTGTSIKFGQSVALSGDASVNGKALQSGLLAAFKEVNDAGGINGRKIELVSLDDGYEPEKTLLNYEKLVNQEKVFALVGVYGAPSNNAILPRLERDGVTSVGPISGANLTEPLRKHLFAVRANSFQEASALVKYAATQLSLKEFGVFFQDDATGIPPKSATAKELAAQKGELKVSANYKRNSTEVDGPVADFLKVKPKAIMFAGLAPAALAFVKKLHEKDKDYHPVLFGISPVSSPTFIKEVVTLGYDFYGAQAVPLVDDSSVPLVKQYHLAMKAANSPAGFTYALEGFVIGSVVVEGLKAAGKDLTRDSFNKGLESLKNFDLHGIIVQYSATDHQGVEKPFLVHLKDGKLVPLK